MFAVDDAYCEGMVRGFRSSFLTHEHYEILKSCTHMETFKAVNCLLCTLLCLKGTGRHRLWAILARRKQ